MIKRTLTDTTTPGQSGYKVMATKEYSILRRPPELKGDHQMQFNVKPRTPLFFGGGESYPPVGHKVSVF